MTDIVDLIRADHERIRALSARLSDGGSDSSSQLWASLADLLELHLDAEEEICFLALFGRGANEARELARAVDDEIREAVREARLHPAGSRPWRLAVDAACRAAADHVGDLESGALARFGRQAPPQAREALGRQWQAFVSGREDDPADAGFSYRSTT
jgi:hypothetical protein